ncbi:unnamed protein product [Lupinus luteus]|uniref:Pectinesterase inhibitor domain-containing protein n=1 Tax=Lupinus luteus TaxID=3873 RepID=A0AAV1W1N0_LUPLU
MNPSTFLSILFTPTMFFISHVSLTTSTINFKWYQVVCTEYSTRVSHDIKSCLKALESDPRIPEAKTYGALSIFIIDQAVKQSTLSQNILKNLMKTDPSPARKECANEDYDETIKAFKNALAYVIHNPQTAKNYLRRDLADVVGKCLGALKDDPKPYFEVNVLISNVCF